MRTLITSALLALTLPMHMATAQANTAQVENQEASDPGGFSVALFDTATVTDLLKDARAIGIRFYNVLIPPGNKDGSALAVGIRADGSEINAGKAYKLSMGFVQGKIQITPLNAKDAKNACAAMQLSRHPSYSASFTRTEVEALMDLPGCQALQATPDVTEKNETTMRLTAMKIIGDKAEPLGTEPRFMRICSFPCPSVCGPGKNYVYRAP